MNNFIIKVSGDSITTVKASVRKPSSPWPLLQVILSNLFVIYVLLEGSHLDQLFQINMLLKVIGFLLVWNIIQIVLLSE